ncbi:MAG TPA: hypothetical protein VKB56_03005 [Terriglobales bacterium]|nr:hypothetical protein [Terriglobales bacterium]
MLVYREAVEQFLGSELRELLLRDLHGLEREHNDHGAVSALITSGELECALVDSASSEAQLAASITDATAAAVIGSASPQQLGRAAETVCRLQLPPVLSIRPLEGFAYYALHPEQYAEMAKRFLRQRECRRTAVVGIRSIGVPLSAVVAAALEAEGLPANRITVRPSGHPSNRELRLSARELDFAKAQHRAGAEFLIVDEGPGRSGSSFLATAEALVAAGVEQERITLLCSYEPRMAALAAPDAARRWQPFRTLWPAPKSLPLPRDAGRDLSAGQWRELFFPIGEVWPASWISTERLKFLAYDGRSILKFEGHGRYGRTKLAHSRQIAHAGFGPECEADAGGFVRYARVAGQPANPQLTSANLKRLAAYCAFRAGAFAAPYGDSTVLETMARFNAEQTVGAVEVTLPVVRRVIPDNRMMPHEWIRTASGLLVKTDGASHGDDHFYPGATDIAWDLAGAIVEWRMPADASREFLSRYKALSGDRADARIPGFVIAYLAFRVGCCAMAAQSCEEAERNRLLHDGQRYRAQLCEAIARPLEQSA